MFLTSNMSSIHNQNKETLLIFNIVLSIYNNVSKNINHILISGLKGHSWGWMIEYAYLYHQYFSMINEKISLLRIHDKKINLGCFFMSINQIMTVMWTLDGCSIKSKLRFKLRNGKRKLPILFIKANSSMNYAL